MEPADSVSLLEPGKILSAAWPADVAHIPISRIQCPRMFDISIQSNSIVQRNWHTYVEGIPMHPLGSKFQRLVLIEGPNPIFAFVSPSGRGNRHSAAVANVTLAASINFLLANLRNASFLDEAAALLFQAVGQAHDAVVNIDANDPWNVPTTELLLAIIIDTKLDEATGAGAPVTPSRCLLSVVIGLPQLFLLNRTTATFQHINAGFEPATLDDEPSDRIGPYTMGYGPLLRHLRVWYTPLDQHAHLGILVLCRSTSKLLWPISDSDQRKVDTKLLDALLSAADRDGITPEALQSLFQRLEEHCLSVCADIRQYQLNPGGFTAEQTRNLRGSLSDCSAYFFFT